jgi:hypothetical protein
MATASTRISSEILDIQIILIGETLMMTHNRFLTTLLLGAVSIVPMALATPASARPRLLPYGPDTCVNGYVWREAFAGDHVCVRPEIRSQAAYDNAQVSARIVPGGGPYGPFTCRNGYVWREAQANDLVCVTPDTRAQAAEDNRLAPTRYARNAWWRP